MDGRLMFEFTVEVRDKTLARVGQILPEDLNLTATVPFNNVGSWTLVIANGHPMVPVLRTPGAGIVVTRTDLGTVLLSGPVVSPALDMSASAPDGMVTVSGVTDDVILADRLAYPQPANSDATTQTAANDARTGTAEDLMYAYVDQNIGPSAQAPNLLTGAQSTFDGTGGGWVNSANGPVSANTTVFHNGTGCLQTTATAAGTVDIASCSAATITTNGKAVAPGDAVAVSAWTMAATTGRSIGIAAQFYDASGVNVGTLFGTRVLNVTSGWTQVTAAVTAPASAAYMRALVEITSAGAAGEVHYLDDVVLTRNYGRRDVRLTLGTNGHRGATLTKAPRFQPLGALLDEIGTVADYPTGTGRHLGFRVVQSGAALTFQTYATADNSAAVRFDVDNGTLASSKVATAAPTVTRTIVAGQGDGTARTMQEVVSTSSLTAETAWTRRIEQFVDQRQTNDPAQLTAAGNDALAQGGLSQFAMQITPADDTSWVFGVDYGLGDIVTVVVRNGGTNDLAATELSTMVTGWVLKADASGKRFGALLGQPSAAQQADFSARLSNLERTGSVTSFATLSDVALSGPSQYDFLQVNSAGKWANTNTLRLGSSLTAAVVNTARASATDDGYASSAIGDTNGRFFIDMSGRHRWGTGSGSTDTFMSRSAAGTLKAEGAFAVGTDLTVSGSLLGAGAPMQRQIFTSGGTWTKPAGAKWVRVICLGGGAGGGGTSASIPSTNSSHAGGGQAGSYAESYLVASTFGTSVTVTVGGGGSGTTGGTTGGSGGTSSFGSFVTAPGGIGGQPGGSGSSAIYGVAGGSGASAGTGQVATAGATGGYGFGGPQYGAGGNGGSSPFGGGGVGGAMASTNVSAPGSNGSGFGAGGGGGAASFSTSAAASGGNGSAGIVIIDTYF
jgi:hypothetical protein